jgi:hypothetical protein
VEGAVALERAFPVKATKVEQKNDFVMFEDG